MEKFPGEIPLPLGWGSHINLYGDHILYLGILQHYLFIAVCVGHELFKITSCGMLWKTHMITFVDINLKQFETNLFPQDMIKDIYVTLEYNT